MELLSAEKIDEWLVECERRILLYAGYRFGRPVLKKVEEAAVAT